MLPMDKFEIVPWYRLSDFYNKTVALFTKQIHGIKLIIALIILLSISNTMTTNVMLRIGEIGTSLALGVKRAGISRIFLSEGILLGCFGGLLGLTVGLLLAGIISSIRHSDATSRRTGTGLYWTNSSHLAHSAGISGARAKPQLCSQVFTLPGRPQECPLLQPCAITGSWWETCSNLLSAMFFARERIPS